MNQGRVALIILASYDDKEIELDKGKHLLEHIAEVAKKERHPKRKDIYNNHHFWRNSTDMHDFLKSDFLLDGKPLIWYQLQSSLESKLIGDVIICTNDDGNENIKSFCEVNEKRIREKDVKYIFIHEGKPKDWKIEIVVRKCLDEVIRRRYNTIVLTTGDAPYINNFDPIASEPLDNKDIIYDLNSKENIWGIPGDDPNPGPFPRFYHWKVKVKNDEGKEEIKSVKETQAFKAKIWTVSELAKEGYESRKSETGGWIGFFRKAIWKKEYRYYVIKYLLKNEPKLSYRVIDSLARLYLRGKYEDIKKKFGLETYRSAYEKINTKLYIPKIETVNHLFSRALNFNVDLRVENKNPGLLEDVDSLEDLFCLEMFLKNALKKTDISIHHDALNELEKYAMPKLKKKVNLYHDFPQVLNWFCSKMGLQPFYLGDYVNERLFPQFTEEMIEQGIRTHIDYNNSLSILP